MASAKKLSQARSYAQKAISFNENFGAPYILIAQLYAGNYKWNDEPALNKCTFFAAIDKLQRAKAVDPSVAEEANKLISSYSAYTPEAKDLLCWVIKQETVSLLVDGSGRLRRSDNICYNRKVTFYLVKI